MSTPSGIDRPTDVDTIAVAANMCPHCHALIGTPHKDDCPDGPGLVGMPAVAVYTAE
jgi:hypothetical protein